MSVRSLFQSTNDEYIYAINNSFFLDLDNIIIAKMAQTVDEAGNKLWQCTDCGHARERKSDIQRHVERKHIEMQVVCNLCSVVFSSRLSLKEHMKYKH